MSILLRLTKLENFVPILVNALNNHNSYNKNDPPSILGLPIFCGHLRTSNFLYLLFEFKKPCTLKKIEKSKNLCLTFLEVRCCEHVNLFTDISQIGISQVFQIIHNLISQIAQESAILKPLILSKR